MVRTTADDHRDEARDHVQKAIEELSPIITGTCWGWGDYNESYALRLKDAFDKLIEVRRLLG